ncbi:MAG: low molecular weight protein arginine phosphatase [Candidatus Zixiibacteriota bacterium]
MGRLKVLLVCTGNTCRSAMAEGALRVLLEGRVDNVDVISAGTGALPGCQATLNAIEAAKTWHADITGHRSRPLSAELIEEADLILVMTPGHYHDVIGYSADAASKTFLLKKYPDPGADGEGVADPIGGPLDLYNQTFLEIGEELGRILPDILDMAKKKG